MVKHRRTARDRTPAEGAPLLPKVKQNQSPQKEKKQQKNPAKIDSIPREKETDKFSLVYDESR